jgi:nucleoid-associated protein YgaU
MKAEGFSFKNAERIRLWGRGILLSSLAIALFAAGIKLGGPGEREPLAVAEVTVGEGDTLWSLAQKYGDPNTYILQRVNQLQSINSIGGRDALQVGQVLLVPVSGSNSKLIYGGGHAKRERQSAEGDDCRFPAKVWPGRNRSPGA